VRSSQLTFGFKVAAWSDVMIRHLERLEQLQPRLFTAMTGGAAGAFATLGEVGPAVQDGVAKRLGLTPMAVPSRSIVDHFTLSGGLISAEAVMMTLGTTIGRQNAHEVVHHAAHIVATSNSGATFLEVLAADPRVNAHLCAAAIGKLLAPASHTGLRATIARDTSARAHAAAARHRSTPQSPTGSAD